jgi:hypothetical protein
VTVVAGLLMWGAFCDERTGLSFTIAAGSRQRSHSRVRVRVNLSHSVYLLLQSIYKFMYNILYLFYATEGIHSEFVCL